MNIEFTPLRRRFERLLATLSAVAVLMSMMVVFAPAALAHHPTITANQTCADGKLVIAYQSISWRTDGGSGSGHDDIRIEVRVGGSGPWTQVGNGAYVSPTYAFSGTFDGAPYLGQSIQVRARADGAWDNGQGGGETNTTSTFSVDQNCDQDATPVNPVVTVSQTCGVADSLQVPATPGVTYMLGNVAVNGDTITGPAAGVLTAVAEAGFALTDPAWSFAFELKAGSPCPGVVTPVSPTIVLSTVCEVQGSVTFPVTTGIRYVLNGVNVSGQTLAGPISGTVLVEVLPGFVLAGGAPTQITFAVAAAGVCDEVLAEVIEPEDEVEAIVVLPLTGVDSEVLLGGSVLLLGLGIYLIHFARRREEG
ncbi:MAG: hypothetical protein M3P87_09560 [Actinomycetota bacterium]|nr:hypothetical protein [Actinomycetota bacterium]